MQNISDEERNRLSQLGREYYNKVNQKRNRYLNMLPTYVIDFLQPGTKDLFSNKLAKELVDRLSKDSHYKPSDFVKENLSQLFNGYLNPAHAEHIYYTIDHTTERVYSYGWNRRSLRSADPKIITQVVSKKLYNFGQYDLVPDNICDYLEGKCSEEELGYNLYHYNADMMLGDLLAAEIDFGNERLVKILEDSIHGETDVIPQSASYGGIMKAHNRSLYELLGRLLVAAGLQEGLRQSICEQMDEGVPEAFTYLLGIIRENNFIRFSSVKRAFAVWLGFSVDDTSKLERVFDKFPDYIYETLTDSSKREEYLSSEDSLKIHVALWSLGFYEVYDMIRKIQELSINGTRHQILSVSYSMHMLNDGNLYHRTAMPLVEKYHDDVEMMAAYMGYFMRYCGLDIAKHRSGVTKYFKDEQEALHFYDILKDIYKNLGGKKKEFKPFIFPWYSVEISRADLAIKLAYIAQVVGTPEIIDEVCGLLPEADVNYRGDILRGLLEHPATDIQRKTLTAALCDKSESIRSEAYTVVKNNKTYLTADNYFQMEEMLRYKYSDARQSLIEFLMEQSDDDLENTIERLLADKKEEKRTAALDMVINISKDQNRKALYDKCVHLVKEMEEPTTKEKILIESIIPGMAKEEQQDTEVLFTDKDQYIPELTDTTCLKECVRTFMDYYPDSCIGKALFPEDYKEGVLGKLKGAFLGVGGKQVAEATVKDLKAFGQFIKLHEKDEFVAEGETHLVGGRPGALWRYDKDFERVLIMKELWKSYFDENIKSPQQFFRMFIMISSPRVYDNFTSASMHIANAVYGKDMLAAVAMEYSEHAENIISSLLKDYVPKEDLQKLAIAIIAYFALAVSKEDLYVKYYSNGRPNSGRSLTNSYFNPLIVEFDRIDRATISTSFPLLQKLYQRFVEAFPEKEAATTYYKPSRYDRRSHADIYLPNAKATTYACYCGVITKAQMYSLLFDEHNLEDTLAFLSSAISVVKEKERQVASRVRYVSWKKRKVLRELEGENDEKFLDFIAEVYEKVINQVLAVELKRGDTPTKYSDSISSIERVYGVSTFVAILSALGKDSLERSSYSMSQSKKGTLSRLLMVCIPDITDDAKTLGEMLAGTDITEKRLVEASLYAPEWIDIIGEHLGWKGFVSGCYYFIAHMNEELDDKKKAIIAKHTPLEPEELRNGAFDVDWFKSVLEDLGEDRLDVIYDAAKYISDGAKHSRARKYADAALGRLDVKETELTISDKRNKDLLMAYPLIPLKGEDDICERYLFLQQFLKESKKFGTQRIASEKLAVGTALQNLSINAGYSDVTRLTLRMETKLVEDMKDFFKDKEVGEVTVKLIVDEYGVVSTSVVKNGKALKAVPAAIKKDEYIKTLTEAKKQLTEQHRRTRQMFEQSMEDRTFYSVEELDILMANPIVEPLIRNLVFVTENGDKLGFISGTTLTDYAGEETKLKKKDNVRVAHSFDIYKDGHLADYQKILFEKEIVQPFKQVFRELYVKTAEEMEMLDSRRYAGNQVQPKKTIALLKSRRWTPDIEDGIQKVYYKENIVATIYAMADWFSPSDIEAPTLEYVAFYDRKSYRPIKIQDVPDIIFSEVMRDVDLAVSVAHVGGVDPETSHSTIEMRAALLEFTLPLFKLSNVTVEKSHAHIQGKLGNYTVHLGSGVVHKMGGAMVNILPVHSQHRGKLFLPFADEDPKTAEVLTKVLFLAQDNKIKDPSILEQIR